MSTAYRHFTVYESKHSKPCQIMQDSLVRIGSNDNMSERGTSVKHKRLGLMCALLIPYETEI
jgi:hypothetical protein